MSDINVVALVKGKDRYMFLFPDEKLSEAINQVGQMAANKDIGFSFFDASYVSTKMKQVVGNHGNSN